MKTAVGCMVWIVVFAGVLLLEHDGLMRLPAAPRGPLLAWGLAAALTLGVVLTAGSLHGLLLALWRRLRPADGSGWRDGQTVHVGGVLEVQGPPLQAPFSGRPAAYLTYSAHTWQRGFEGTVRQEPHFHGLQHADCRLRIGSRVIALRGFPSPRAIDEQAIDGPEVAAAAAAHLARTPWQEAPHIANADLAALDNPFAAAAAGAGAGAGRHLMNRLAREVLGLPGHAGQAGALLDRLRERPWHFKERVLAPGTTVTAIGTWREQPPHLDIGYGPTTAGHALHPGPPARVATRELLVALVFTVVLGALTVAAHAAVWHDGGAWLRAAGQAAGIPW